VNFWMFPSELLDGIPELHVHADTIFMLIFIPLIGLMHTIYRWIRTEISQLFHVQCFPKFCTV
jgi:hypothetical protein